MTVQMPFYDYVIRHNLGLWIVRAYNYFPQDEKQYMLQFDALAIGDDVCPNSKGWRTVNQAVGYVKRLAKHSPDSSGMILHLVPWGERYHLYFEK